MKFDPRRWRIPNLNVSRGTPRPPDPPGVTVSAAQVRQTQLASWLAYACLVYFLWLYTLDIARDRAGALHLTHVGGWVGDVQVWFPYIIGFAIIAAGIPYVAKIAIPTFMSLSWRNAAWPKAWALFIATAVSLVVIAGTFTVQGDTLLERDRVSAVAVAQVEQGAAALSARIADTQHRLDEMTRSESVYIRTAASMSPAAYDAFVESRRGDWQYDRLRSYRATAVDAERLRGEIGALRAQQAAQTTTAAVAARPETGRTAWIAATLAWLEGARAMLLSFVMDIVCLIMPWIAQRLEHVRNAQLAQAGAGPAPEAVMIEDMRDDEAPTPQPMDPPREVIRDGVTGEELVRVNVKQRSYLRKKPKGKAQRLEIPPEDMADERGAAIDGGGRTATAAMGVPVLDQVTEPEPDTPEDAPAEEPVAAELSDDDLDVLADSGDLGLGADGREGVVVREDELEGV